MSAEAVGWVYRHSPYTGVAFAVHLAIADSANDQHDYELWARQEWIASKARTSRSSVNRALSQMVDDGMLEVLEDNVGAPNRYRLLLPDRDVEWTGVTRRDTPPEGVPNDDTGVSRDATGGVSRHDTTNNPSDNPTVEPNTTSPAVADDPTNDYDDEVVELCRLFARRLVVNGKSVPKRGTSAAAGWLDDMRKLLEYGQSSTMDGPVPDAEEVRRVIEYVTSDPFEQNVVLSIGKLRARWDQLAGKARRNGGRSSDRAKLDKYERLRREGLT